MERFPMSNSRTGSGRLDRPNSGDFGIARTPSSPTDEMMSPITKQIRLKKVGSFLDGKKREKKNVDCDLKKSIQRTPFPCGQIPFILGTSSANRKEVIESIGWSFEQMSPDIDEKAIRTSDPMELPQLIARAKADAITARLRSEGAIGEKIILTADQIVLYRSEIREKPETVEEAREYLHSYSGSSVATISAVVITHFPSLEQRVGIDVATIIWDTIPDDVIERVIARGEIFSSAGGFRIEDPDLNPLLIDIDGSIDSVYGMPLKLTMDLLCEVSQATSVELDSQKL